MKKTITERIFVPVTVVLTVVAFILAVIKAIGLVKGW
jgi:hypothetical protein